MLGKIIYRNHMNEVLEFGKDGLFICESDLLDFTWKISSRNGKISGFQRETAKKNVQIVIKGKSTEEAIRLKNKLFEVFEKDVIAVKHGRFIIGDYYLKCFAIESKKNNYIEKSNYIEITITISSDFPYWIKERKTSFGYGTGTIGTNMDFNRDTPADYTSNLAGTQLNNTDFVASNFKLIIYGQCENPSIVIGGHEYRVDVSVEANEYLTINSVEKTIMLTGANGKTKNCFNMRNRDSYIFQKIPSGISNVSTSREFSFDVILLEERSEPKWT